MKQSEEPTPDLLNTIHTAHRVRVVWIEVWQALYTVKTQYQKLECAASVPMSTFMCL
jgi:hypothetical protein